MGNLLACLPVEEEGEDMLYPYACCTHCLRWWIKLVSFALSASYLPACLPACVCLMPAMTEQMD